MMHTIRPMKLADIPELLPLLQAMYLEHDEAEPDLFNPNSFSNMQIQAMLEESISSSDQMTYVATDGANVIGTIRVEIKKPETFYKDALVAYLDDLVVHPDHRRQGVAQSLVEKALSYAREHEVSLIESKIYLFNTASRALMAKQGFRETFSYFYKRLDESTC